MKNIPSTNPLQIYGVNILTGEACAFGMRLLCDLTEQGVLLIADYWGIPNYPLQTFHPNWNSQVNGVPAVASIMLAREIFPHLIRFTLFREGYQYVYGSGDQWDCTAFNDVDVEENPYLKTHLAGETSYSSQGWRVFRNPKNPSQPSKRYEVKTNPNEEANGIRGGPIV